MQGTVLSVPRAECCPDYRTPFDIEYAHKEKQGDSNMKGYFVKDGFMGLVNGTYRLFADETDYMEYFDD